MVLSVLWWVFFTGPPNGEKALPEDVLISTVYFYDLADKKVFVDRSDKFPPFEREPGHECVYAVIYGCGGCDAQHAYIAYFEKFTSAGQSILTEYRSFNLALTQYPNFGEECLVSTTGEPGTWYKSTSPEGEKVVMAVLQRCREVPLRCTPTVKVEDLEKAATDKPADQ